MVLQASLILVGFRTPYLYIAAQPNLLATARHALRIGIGGIIESRIVSFPACPTIVADVGHGAYGRLSLESRGRPQPLVDKGPTVVRSEWRYLPLHLDRLAKPRYTWSQVTTFRIRQARTGGMVSFQVVHVALFHVLVGMIMFMVRLVPIYSIYSSNRTSRWLELCKNRSKAVDAEATANNIKTMVKQILSRS